MADHPGGCADGTPYEPVVDKLAAGLDACAQKGIRRTAQHQVLLFGQGCQFAAFLIGGGKGFFAVDMLARPQRCLCRLIVLEGPGQIQDNLNLRVLHHFFHGGIAPGNLVRLFRRGHLLRNQVIDTPDLHFPEQFRQIFQVNPADGPQAQDTDFDFFHLCFLSVFLIVFLTVFLTLSLSARLHFAISFSAVTEPRIVSCIPCAAPPVFQPSNRSVVRPWSRTYCLPCAAQSIPRSISTWAWGDFSNTSS